MNNLQQGCVVRLNFNRIPPKDSLQEMVKETFVIIGSDDESHNFHLHSLPMDRDDPSIILGIEPGLLVSMDRFIKLTAKRK